MTKLDPKVEAGLKQHGLKYEVFECDPELADTAAFCEHYGFKPEESLNTIIIASKKTEPQKFIVCTALATTRLDVNKKACELMGVKRASFASAEQTVEQTGMMIGGVTVPGIESLPIYIDQEVLKLGRVIMGGGSRSAKIILDPNELKKLPNVRVVEGLART